MFSIAARSINTRYCAKVIAYNTFGQAAAAYTLPKYTLANPPSAPSVAANYSEAQSYYADISINANSNPATTNYRLTWDTNPAGAFAGVLQDWTAHANGDSLTHTDLPAGLTCNQAYYYRAIARNGDGVTTATATGNDTTPPCAPTGPTASGITASGATLDWDAMVAAASFTVSFGTDALATNLGTTAGIATNTTPKAGLTALTDYYFKVRAVNGNGTGAWSSIATFTTLAGGGGGGGEDPIIDVLKIALPGESFVAGTGVTGMPNHQVAGTPFTAPVYAVTTANQIVTNYNNTVSFSNTTDNFIPIYSPNSPYPALATALASGQKNVPFTFFKTGEHIINMTGSSGSSSVFTVDPGPTSPTLSTVAPAVATVSAGATVTLDVILKDIYTNLIPGHRVSVSSDQIGDVITLSSDVTDSNARIRAYATSALAHTSTLAITDATTGVVLATLPRITWTYPPIAIGNPTDFTGRAGDSQNFLYWRNPVSTYFSHIEIYRSLTAGALGTKIADNITGTSYIDTGLTNGTTYYYILKAVDTFGSVSSGTNQIALTPFSQVITDKILPPTNLRATAIGTTTISLAWNAPTGKVPAVGYILYNAETGIEIVRTANTSFDLSGLMPDTVYKFYVVALDASANISGPSNVLTVRTKVLGDNEIIDPNGSRTYFMIMTNAPDEILSGLAFPNAIKIVVADAGGRIKTDYVGNVYFTSSDAKAKFVWTQSNPYHFSSSDAGSHEFAGSDFKLFTTGTQTLHVSDGALQDEAKILVKGTLAPTMFEDFGRSSRDFTGGLVKIDEAVITATSILLLVPLLINTLIGLSNLGPQLYYWFLQFLQLVGLRKRPKPWGVVFNSQTGQPLATAIVRIYDKEYNKLLDTAVTDQEGRFGFLVRKGSFYLKAKKSDYSFPSQFKTSGFFGNVYTGQTLTIEDPNESVTVNIPLDPQVKPSFGQKIVIALVRFNKFLLKLSLVSLIVGTAFTVIMVLTNYHILYLLSLVFYSLMFGLYYLRSFKGRSYGLVTDSFGAPLDLVIVRIFEHKSGKLVATDVTDSQGRFLFLVSPGVYYLTAVKPGYLDFKSHIMYLEKERTMVSSNIKLKKIN